MEKNFKDRVLKPLGIYTLAFSLVLPSLSGVVEAANETKEAKVDTLIVSQEKKIEETKAENGLEVKKEAEKELENILSGEEIQDIKNRANSLENDYFFNGDMFEELKAELRKAKADPSVNYEEAKARLINEAILKNAPAQKAPGQDRAVRNFNIKDADKLEAEMTEINVRGLGMEAGQIIEVLVNGEVKGTFTQGKRVKSSVIITISEALKEGDKVKAILKGSDGVQIAETEEATVKKRKPKKAEIYKDTLKMPEGEIWIEQYVANIVSDEEKAEALELLKKANQDIAKDIESVDFKIEGVDPKIASYIVTYDDNSKSDKISAPNLTVKQVTEKSQVPNITKTYIADGQITITLDKNVEAGTKIGIVKQFTEGEDKNFCSDQDDTCSTGSCKADKSTPTWVTVESTTNTFTYNVDKDFLQLGQDFGVIVKEPRKLASCKRTQPHVKVPNVEVRDPKKLTETEKEEIRKKIREANTREDGVSKLPDWTVNSIPAYIEFDKDGNVKIINPSEVEGDWIDDYTKFVPKRNPDGSLQMKTGKENSGITVNKEELLINKAPDAPRITTDVDKGEITITPSPLDTDAKKIEVNYTDPEGNPKTEIIEKENGGNGKWKAPEGSKLTVDEKTGVVTIKFENIKNKTNVEAKVTDEGGIANNDKDPKTSDNKSEQIKIYPKKPNITVDETTGDVTITPVEKDSVAKKMDITYVPVGSESPKTVTAEKKDGKWTVPEDSDFMVSEDGKNITITNNKIKSDTQITAKTNDGDTSDLLESEIENKNVLDKTAPNPPKVEVDTETGNITITPPTDEDTTSVIVTYKKDANTEIKVKAKKTDGKWSLAKEDGTPIDNDEKVDETSGVITLKKGSYKTEELVTAYGNDDANNKSKDDNKTPVEVKFEANGGSKTMDASILALEKANSPQGQSPVLPAVFELPECKFIPPAGKEFAGWQVGNDTKKAGDKIKVAANTSVKALWKDKNSDQNNQNNQNNPGLQNKENKKSLGFFKIIEDMEIGRHYKYLYGYTDGSVRPEGLMTRAEAAALIARLANLDMTNNTKPNFKDTASAWYNSAINIMVKKDLMFADKDGNFRPNQPITRGEFARAIYYIDKKNDKIAPFADVKGHEFEEAINQAYGNGRIAGYEDGTFRPDAYIQRAEAARILNQYARRNVTLEGLSGVKKDLIHFTDISESHWAYCEIMEAANSHEYQRAKGSIPETWIKIIEK